MYAHQSVADSRQCKCLRSQSHRSSSIPLRQLPIATKSLMRWPLMVHQIRWKTRSVPSAWVSSDTSPSSSKSTRMLTLSHLGLTAWTSSTRAPPATMSSMANASKLGWPGRGAAPAAEQQFESPSQNEHSMPPNMNELAGFYHQACLWNIPWATSWHIQVCCSVMFLKQSLKLAWNSKYLVTAISSNFAHIQNQWLITAIYSKNH